MSRTTPGCPGHPGPRIVSDPQATSATKLNSRSLSPGRRVAQIPAWVPPSLKKVPMGITERASDCHPNIPVVDSFEKANCIYKSKLWRGSPPKPKSNGRTGIHKQDTSISPVGRATERLSRQSFSPTRLMERETRGANWGALCSKFHDDSLGTTTVSSPTTKAASKADESAFIDRSLNNALNRLNKKPDLFPCRDSPRPQESSETDSREAELDLHRYGDLEGRGNAVYWRNLSPVERRHEESRLYEKMIFATQHANLKSRAESVGGLSLRI